MFHFRKGIRYRIPVCCIIHFCWDNMLATRRRHDPLEADCL